MSDTPHLRQVRSFVRRAGRQTKGQERALAELWPRYGLLSPDTQPNAQGGTQGESQDTLPKLDLSAAFGRTAPCAIEIGFGNGDALLGMATAHPERDFLGIEVHRPGIGHCLLQIEQLRLSNVRLIMQDALLVLRDCLADASVLGIHLYFPDPWHKKRHHKRRIVQPSFVALLAKRLISGGYFHVATDWPEYAAHIQSVFEENESFRLAPSSARGLGRPRTRFENRGERLGHPIWEAMYVRQD